MLTRSIALLLFVLTRVSSLKHFKGDPGVLGDLGLDLEDDQKILSRKKRVVTFPSGSTFTLSNEFSIPAFSKKDGDITGVLKGTIHVRYTFPNVLAIGKRSIDNERFEAYESLINMFNSFGMSGEVCLLRLVCETAGRSVANYGVLGEVVEMLLTPTHGLNGTRGELKIFTDAESLGRRKGNCYDSYASCPLDLEQFLHTGTALLKNSVRDSLKWKRNSFSSEL